MMMMMAAPITTPASATPTLGGFQWGSLLKHNDVLLSIGMVVVIGMMLIPLPSLVLDFLLTINIAMSITIFLVTLYTKEPLQYSTFPTLLLMSTLFRLGLNVSATRLILLTGQPGEVITAFGNFVVGGNYLVGLLIFIILMVINFMVITNGAGRVSEVSARFTLDALPGKQLSIDADLNAGLINETQARQRRLDVQREADFYGTMDGASKFVKGDAMAAIIITLINIIFGLLIGVLQMGMPLEQAAATFTILTVGDGLVSSLPALVISTATGLLVTRVSASEDSSLGDDLGNQLFSNPKVLGVLGGVLTLLGFVPGMPNLPFLVIGALAIIASYFKLQQLKKADKLAKDNAKAATGAGSASAAKSQSEQVMDLLAVEPLELEMGYRLVPLIEEAAGGDLLERITNIRKQMASELGLVLPSIRVRDNLQLEPNVYVLKLKGIGIGEGSIMSDMVLAMAGDPSLCEPLKGVATTEPAFNLPATWIEPEQKDEAELNGYTVIIPAAVVATHLTELVRKHAAQLLSRGDTQLLLDNLKKSHAPLVEDLIPTQLTLAEVQLVLQRLLEERVSIKDLSSILEALSYHCRISKAPEYLVEQCRMALNRSLCQQHVDETSGQLPVLTLAPELEETLAGHLVATNNASGEGQSTTLALPPTLTQSVLKQVNEEVERVLTSEGLQPVLLCNARLRTHVRKLLERLLPQLAVLSYNEIGPSVKVRSLGSIRNT
jgi:flagellar biosynthesis protein FlhA